MAASITAAKTAFKRAKALFLARDWEAFLAVAKETRGDGEARERAELLSMQARALFLHMKREREGLAAIEQAARLDPGNPRIQEVRAQLLFAGGQAARAFGIHKRLWRSGEKPERAQKAMFQILMDRKRYAAAERLAPGVEALGEPSPSLERNLVELALVRHDAEGALRLVDRSAGPSPGLAQFNKIARSLEAEMAAGDTMAGYRHLAIAGVAFTGSTAMGVILGSMPGWAFAGETQWLTNVRLPSGEMESIRDNPAPPERWPVACMVCLRHCQCFDVDFRAGLAANETGWYAKIADRLGVKNLISADKNLYLYWALDPLFRFDYIVLYKSPAQHVRSLLKQRLRRPEPRPPIDRDWVFAGLERWAGNYLGHLKSIRPTGRRVVLEWERFVAEPSGHAEALAGLLDIPLSGETLNHIRLGHFIGGNMGVDLAALKADPKFVLRPSNAPELPEEVERMVLQHDRSQRVLRLLETEYRRDFSHRV